MQFGIDLGGTKIEIVAVMPDGSERGRIRAATPAGNYRATIAAVADLISQAEEAWGPPGSIGIGTPGAIDPGSGLLKNANSTVLNGRPFLSDLEAAVGRSVLLANDADCLALSECHDGAARGLDPVFAVILGTGVGGAIVANGRLVRGPNAISGEWGHLPFPASSNDVLSPQHCWCGRVGCVETFLSGAGLARDYESRVGRPDVGPVEISRRAVGGDQKAGASIRAYADRLARALAIVINVLDPEVIVLGGGLSNLDALYGAVPAAWQPFVFSDVVNTKLVRALHGDSSGGRGAARLQQSLG